MKRLLPRISSQFSTRHLAFAALCVLIAAMFWPVLEALAALALHDERYSHILVVPAICGSLVYLNRRRIFADPAWAAPAAIPLMAASMLAAFARQNSLPAAVLMLVVACAAAFALCYGVRAFRLAIFPLALLMMAVPPPEAVLAHATRTLQIGSAELTHTMFNLLGVPVFREGFEFTLLGVQIEIAEECSGIRSSTALVITTLIAGYVFLRSAWTRTILVLIAAPALILKNAVRIVTLSYLAAYVDPSFLHGDLHHRFGSVFALVALAIVGPAILLLQRIERRVPPANNGHRGGAVSTAGAPAVVSSPVDLCK